MGWDMQKYLRVALLGATFLASSAGFAMADDMADVQNTPAYSAQNHTEQGKASALFSNIIRGQEQAGTAEVQDNTSFKIETVDGSGAGTGDANGADQGLQIPEQVVTPIVKIPGK